MQMRVIRFHFYLHEWQIILPGDSISYRYYHRLSHLMRLY